METNLTRNELRNEDGHRPDYDDDYDSDDLDPQNDVEEENKSASKIMNDWIGDIEKLVKGAKIV